MKLTGTGKNLAMVTVMSDITKRLSEAAKYYPRVEDQPYSLFVDSLAEIERLRVRVADLTCALKEAAEAYDGEFSRGIPETWQIALDGLNDEPDLVWDYENGDEGGGGIGEVISNASERLNPGESTVIRALCAKKLPDRWMQVYLFDDGEEQEVKWDWVDEPVQEQDND